MGASKPKQSKCPQCGETAALALCFCSRRICDPCRLGLLHDLCLTAYKPIAPKPAKLKAKPVKPWDKHTKKVIAKERLRGRRKFVGNLFQFLVAADSLDRSKVNIGQGGREY